jgi:hypothetical protein
VVDVGRLQDTVMIWTPAAWLNIKCAYRLFTRQRSNSAEKSAIETAGGGLEQAGSPTLVHAPPLTSLAHMAVGETRDVGGEGKC